MSKPKLLLDLPAGIPDDVRALARLAATEGPALLGGFSPDEAGLLLVHPGSDACPDATHSAVLQLAPLDVATREAS